ncbi:MAG: phosphotransferase family protein [Actinomycetota bacterium]|jgi:aminoglycoside phosphotransferase (APT) family kinase protein|nr:phosphotransferase family protein [Actinomycetota bacterium]
MPDNAGRDPDEVATTLARWLATRLPADAEPGVAHVQAPESNGFSNETILCRASWQGSDGPVDRRLVVRVAPTRNVLFLDADFSIQYRVMAALADGQIGLPLPKLGWFEDDPSWLGVPFFTMDHVDGLVPPDNLPYTMEGWVVDAAPADQERMWWTGLEAMARVHRADWRGLGLGCLGERLPGRPGLDQQLDYYRAFLDWTAQGRPQPVAEAAWRWLVDHRPRRDGDPVLCWGDARPGNIIWDDFTPAAVLDWEMATLGPPELDLGWWLYFDRQFTEGLNVPRPPGFPSREETVQRYAELIGRPLADLEYYEVFSGFRFSVIMCRLADLMVGSGQLPADTDMGVNNLATQFTAQMLGLPPPGG